MDATEETDPKWKRFGNYPLTRCHYVLYDRFQMLSIILQLRLPSPYPTKALFRKNHEALIRENGISKNILIQ
jgi:hypothetical protein